MGRQPDRVLAEVTLERAAKDGLRSCLRGVGPAVKARALPFERLGELPGCHGAWCEAARRYLPRLLRRVPVGAAVHSDVREVFGPGESEKDDVSRPLDLQRRRHMERRWETRVWRLAPASHGRADPLW